MDADDIVTCCLAFPSFGRSVLPGVLICSSLLALILLLLLLHLLFVLLILLTLVLVLPLVLVVGYLKTLPAQAQPSVQYETERTRLLSHPPILLPVHPLLFLHGEVP